MASLQGLPLLSGPPPTVDSSVACRRCNKEFNFLFTRSRRCNHCGYLFCHSCSDFQALMPRTGAESGYDAVSVCGYCIELLNITAAGVAQLRGTSLGKLKSYADSYDININRAVEKGDIVEAIVRARLSNGCLPSAKEDYYRKNKVPNPHVNTRPRTLFSRGNQSDAPPPRPQGPTNTGYNRHGPTMNSTPHSQRPNVSQPHATPYSQPQYPVHNGPPPQSYNHHSSPYAPYNGYPSHPHPHHHPHGPASYNAPPYAPPFQQTHHAPPQPPPPETRPPPPPRPNTASANRPPPPPPPSRPDNVPQTPPQRTRTTSMPSQPQGSPPSAIPMPTLDQLLVMTRSSISALPIAVLKNILFTNHVNASMILEKSELVNKVITLVEDEKRERDRQRAIEEAERMEEEERRMARDEAIRKEQEEKRRRDEEERIRKERRERHRARVEEVEDDMDDEVEVEVEVTENEEEEEFGYHDRIGGHTEASTSSTPPKSTSTPQRSITTTLERSGLCVICQDEEANIAIVDCGHLAMCRACSELVMTSSRECPLCRTRIVTEARLLRIFKS